MKAPRTFWILVYFVSPLAIASLIFAARPSGLSNPSYFVSVLLGTAPFVWLVNQFIISARPKFIEKYFGMDNLYRFHGVMATISFVLIFIHRLFKIALTGLQPLIALIALILLGIVTLMAAIFLVDSFLRRFKPVEDFRKFMIQRIGYKRKMAVLLHNSTLVIIILILLHVLNSAAAYISPALKWTYIGYFALGMSFYVYHQLIRPWRMKKNAWQVLENRPEAPDVRTLRIAPRRGDIFSYKPGQFALLTVIHPRLVKESHPFTIASSPSRTESISFSIKASGDFTSQLDQVQAGDEVRIDAPYGIFSFILHPEEQELVFIAGGIGITPLLSMLRYLQDTDPQRKATLLWGVRTQADLICVEEINNFTNAMPHFSWVPVLSDEPDWQGEKGFFDQEKIKRLALTGRDLATTGFYVCGPRVMMNLVAGELEMQGVPKAHIHFEKFAF